MFRGKMFLAAWKKKRILATPYYKPQCSKPGKKVAAYSLEFTVDDMQHLGVDNEGPKLPQDVQSVTKPSIHHWYNQQL